MGGFRAKTVLLGSLTLISGVNLFALGLSVVDHDRGAQLSRRKAIGSCFTGIALVTAFPDLTEAADEKSRTPDRFDVDDYLKSGFVSNPMGVSGQAGKSKPNTGVLVRDGSEVSRDPRTGDVLAEILVQSRGQASPVLASFSSPWPLATGTVFDVECRDASTGDGVFLAVTESFRGKDLADVNDSTLTSVLFNPTGRFSFYGPPTDIKIKKSEMKGNRRELEMSFSTLSQSTQTEIPRKAKLVAVVPEGMDQAVMLVGSTSSLRWKKGGEEQVDRVMDSFRAIPAPQTSLKVRAKERRSS